MQARVIHGSRWKAVLMSAVGGLLTTYMIAALVAGERDWYFWVGGLLFGVGTVGAFAEVCLPSRLTLSPHYFEVR